MDNNDRIYQKAYNSIASRESRRLPIDDEIKGRNSVSGQVYRKSTSILRSMSDGVEWGNEGASSQNLRDGLDRERFHELEKEAPRRSYVDETQRYKSVKGLKDHALSSSRFRASPRIPESHSAKGATTAFTRCFRYHSGKIQYPSWEWFKVEACRCQRGRPEYQKIKVVIFLVLNSCGLPDCYRIENQVFTPGSSTK
ncbi:Uncharacterized protein Fot_36906 [Forsythia ovata]|uniref:Uncharacterized protein n=1 Tax=Forsythia ovata TaxID=205694 RepID=A0ABD1SQS6_9LAMI